MALSHISRRAPKPNASPTETRSRRWRSRPSRSLRRARRVCPRRIIRPDYATAPRLSAQLSIVIGIGEALRQGAFFRSPAALDRLLGANVYVFDDSACLDRGRIATASICVAGDRPPEDVLTLATAAFAKRGDARASALRLESARRKIDLPHLSRRRRVAGAIRFEDDDGRLIEVATTAYVDRAALVVPDDLASALAEADVSLDPAQDPRDPDLRPLWVARDGRILWRRFLRAARTRITRRHRGATYAKPESALSPFVRKAAGCGAIRRDAGRN